MIAFCWAGAARAPELFIDSITIVRNGYIVADSYPNPNFPRDELHIMHSATKSIISALVAIEEGHIESFDRPVIDFFSGHEIENLDERKKAVTIRDLLSMQSGLHTRGSYLYAYEGAVRDSEER